MTTMNLVDVLRIMDHADVIVDGGFISTASRVGNDWHLTVLNLDTRVKVRTIVVPRGGDVEVTEVVR